MHPAGRAKFSPSTPLGMVSPPSAMPETDSLLSLPSDRDASGRDLGAAELALLTEAIESGHLNSTGGTLVPRFEQAFARRMGRRHATACNSGSAAVHAALGALRLRPGDEIVTTAITDMGAILPICYEGATPVFADVDPVTANVTPASIEARLTPRTRAVVVTHLFGMPCDMDPIVALASAHDIVIIEDCAQAFLAEDRGRMIGTAGHIACYSFQQGKHMTTGEGGIVLADDDELAGGVARFVNKGWGYGDAAPDHDRPGLNYRMTELQAAVGIPQLEKLASVVERRQRNAARLEAELADVPGLVLPNAALPVGSRHAYWRFALRVDPDVIPGGTDALGANLARVGVYNSPRYIKKPAYDCAVLGANGRFPCRVDRADMRGTDEALAHVLVLPWNEHYTEEHCDAIATEIRHAVDSAHRS